MSYFSGDAERDAEIAKAEALVLNAAKMLKKHPNPLTKLGIMWELAYIKLRDLEKYRRPK